MANGLFLFAVYYVTNILPCRLLTRVQATYSDLTPYNVDLIKAYFVNYTRALTHECTNACMHAQTLYSLQMH